MDELFEELKSELQRAQDLKHGGDTEAYDRENTKNDWVAMVNAYTGRAAARVARNVREGQTFRVNMMKAAGLCLSAIKAHDEGHC